MYPSDAGALLRSVGLGVKKVDVHGPIDSDSGNAGFGMVYRQTPKAGARVPRGTAVEIRSWWEMG
jgi:beta-lactam-binding protein with PASTA domain